MFSNYTQITRGFFIFLGYICLTVALQQDAGVVAQKKLLGRIINGTEAVLANTKHQVSIRLKSRDQTFFGTGHVCGGSMITRSVVLSAAHCFVDYAKPVQDGTFLPMSDFNVVMGSLNVFKKDANTLIYEIKKRILGVEKFDLGTYNFDIALLLLDNVVPENHPTVQPIQLYNNSLVNGTMCTVTGWGVTELGTTSATLLTVDVPYLDNETCLKYSAFSPEIFIPGMMCAGFALEGHYDACQGDSGGPMVCNHLQAGIVSWGEGCALPGYPGMYTEVKYYLPWIQDRLRENNLELPNFPLTPSDNGTSSIGISFTYVLTLVLTLAYNINL